MRYSLCPDERSPIIYFYHITAEKYDRNYRVSVLFHKSTQLHNFVNPQDCRLSLKYTMH